MVIKPYWKGRRECEILRGKFKIDIFLCMPRAHRVWYTGKSIYNSANWTGRDSTISSWWWPVRFNIGFDR